MTRLAALVVGVLVAVCAAEPPGLGKARNKQSNEVYTSVSVIADNQGGFPAGWIQRDGFGYAIGRIGDVNNDNITDFVVGAPYDDDAGSNAGAVYVLQMTAQRTVGTAFKITKGMRGFTGDLGGSDYFGCSADGIGDVDGNGVLDIAVGAYGGFTGAAYVMLMDANVQVNTTVKITTGQGGFPFALSYNDNFGIGLAGVGDLDGDGVGDIAVGAWQDDTGGDYIGDNIGAVYILRMLRTGRVSSATKIARNMGGLSSWLSIYGQFGYRIAALGDVSGDGVPDIAVGAHDTGRGGQSHTGSVYILHLTPNGTVAHDYEITSHTSGFDHSLESGAYFSSPSRVGDVDGDGIDDLVVGADGYWDGNSVFVLLLDGNGLVREHHQITDINTGNYFGRSVSFVERGTGVSLLVGTPGFGTNSGRVYVVDLVDRSSAWPILPSPSPANSGSVMVPMLWALVGAALAVLG